MQILLTFDVEVWCNGSGAFPESFRRYVYGASRLGEYALPKILDILRRHRLHGVFFVEPVFAARFGIEYLRRIVTLIRSAGQEIQLHLHSEWADDTMPLPLDGRIAKRQYLHHYNVEEQTALIALGIRLLQEAGAPRPSAFRAGNFGANRDTFRALERNGIRYDSSIDAAVPDSVPDLRHGVNVYAVSEIANVVACPMSVFQDGSGRLRHAQVGACSSGELLQAIRAASALGWRQFVILSHNFEMLKLGSTAPDWIVYRRFTRVCDYLGQHAADLPTVGFDAVHVDAADRSVTLPTVGRLPTLRRYAEQTVRRFL